MLNNYRLILIACLFLAAFSSYRHKDKKKVVIAYVGGYRGLVNVDSIEVDKLTIINYAFVDLKDGRAFLHNLATDTIDLRNLAAARRRNPALKVLISVGGWSWSKGFSDAVLTDPARRLFAASAVAIVAAYDLDGIDIDWEYPGLIGDGNVFRPEDKGNYTSGFKIIRQCLDSLARSTGKTYLLTTAVGASGSFISHTEMNKAQVYLDYVNLMSYDFKEGSDSRSGHYTNLYASAADPEQRSADKAVQEFEAAGVPADKLVMGIAFYGHGWKMRTLAGNGLYQPSVSPFRAGGFTYIKDSLVDQNGYKRYWDKKAQAPYLFEPKEKIFISYATKSL